MASVLHLSHLHPTHSNRLFPETEPLSLSLDLSLGGLFSKQNSNLHLSLEGLKASQSSNSPVGESKAETPSRGNHKCDTGSNPARVDPTPLPNASHKPAELLRTRSLQAQRRHEARKRRKSINEGKLHKRAKGDSQAREELTTSNAYYLEFITPGCDESKARLFNDAGKMNFEESMCEEDVPASAYSWARPDFAAGQLGHGVPSASETVETKDVMCTRPAPMVDYMNVLGTENDVRIGVKSLAPPEVSHNMCMDGNVSYTCDSLHHALPSEFMYKQDVSSDVKPELNGDLSSLRQSVLSCASSGLLTSYAPYGTGQKDQPHAQTAKHTCGGNAHCSEVTIPTRGSSSQLLSWQAGEMHDSTHDSTGIGDVSDCVARSCNSSSSEIGNKTAIGDEQGRHGCKEEVAHVEQSSVTMPAGISMAYPHSFPVVSLPYPYGVPLPWGYSLPWFTPGSAQNAFGVPIASPPSKEPFVIPFGGLPTPYQLPVPGSNITPWIPFIPTGGFGTMSTSSESSILSLSNGEICKTGRKGEETSESGQDAKPRGDLPSLHEMQTASVEEDREGNVVSHVGNIQKAQHAKLAMKEKLEEHVCFVVGDDKSSAQMHPDMLPDKGDSSRVVSSSLHEEDEDKRVWQAASEKSVAAGTQQSLPLAKVSAPKKKKVVRFNSLTVAAAPSALEEGNEACQSVDSKADWSSSSQQCGGALSNTSTDAEALSSEHSHNEVGDVRQNSIHNEECISSDKNISGAVEHSAGDVTRDGSAFSQPCKSDSEDNVGSHSVTSLPRVITRGSGPYGKTIHGVMYITKEKQARLICVCHGKHMSPLEFVQHSGSADVSHPERSIVLEPFTYVDHEIPVTA